MPRVTIDNQTIDVPEGSTVLQAARKLGIDIPTLCHYDGLKPETSCMICLVKLADRNGLVPSCATPVEDGMCVESETPEVHQVRKTGLELLLTDHLGDCVAPCQHTCPTHMNIPQMLRQVAAGELEDAIETVKQDIALPAVLGRVCPDLCERTCRRNDVDSPAAICLVKRHVADVDLATQRPYLPPQQPATGKRVAIIGAGPTGLSCAYHLQQFGHACTIFDEHAEPGGMLLTDFDETQLPRSVLAGEVGVIRELGAVFEMNVRIGAEKSIADLSRDFDAVLVAAGAMKDAQIEALGLPASCGRLQVNLKTHETPLAGVFAAGDAALPSKMAVRSVAAGKSAARCIDLYVSGQGVTGAHKMFNVRIGKLAKEEVDSVAAGASEVDRVVPIHGVTGGLTAEEAQQESARCLHCDCSSHGDCGLQGFADRYGVTAPKNPSRRQELARHYQHANIIFEPGKCILCGLCVQVAREAGEPLGLTFIGRGFDVRIDVPFDGTLADGLQKVGERCAEVCPVGALSKKTDGCGVGSGCGTCGPSGNDFSDGAQG